MQGGEPQVKQQQIHRLQRHLRRHPQQRKMRSYDTLGATFSFVFGFALGTAITFSLLPLGEDLDWRTGGWLARLLTGFLGGLLFGFLPAGAFAFGFRLHLFLSSREPRSNRPPLFFGFVFPPLILGFIFALEALEIDTAWAVWAMLLWAMFSGWCWVRLSPNTKDFPI